LYADTLFVEPAEAEDGGDQALLGGALEPDRGLRKVARNAAALGIAQRNFIFGGGIALRRCGPQAAAADARRQLVTAGIGGGIAPR
jgi:hypothetical protein